MKKLKIILWIILFSIVILLALLSLNKCVFSLEKNELNGNSAVGKHISVIGDYVFYRDKIGMLAVTKVKKIGTNDEKIFRIGYICDLSLHDDKLYYSGDKISTKDFPFLERNTGSVFEKRIVDGVKSYRFCNDNLFYQKKAYSTDDDGAENGYIFRVNQKTGEHEALIKCRTGNFDIVNDNIYYSKYITHGFELYGVSEDIMCYSQESGEETVVVHDLIGKFGVKDNTIVYSKYVPSDSAVNQSKKYNLVVFDIDTNENVEICEDVVEFDVFGDYIAFINGENQNLLMIYNCTDNTTTSVNVNGIDADYGFVLCNNKIFYYNQNQKLCVESF